MVTFLSCAWKSVSIFHLQSPLLETAHFSTDLVIEFIARGVEINLLAFSYKKKPRGGGGGGERSRS